MNAKTVVVKMCGHCSPRQDMMEFAKELKEAATDLDFVFFSQCESGNILLILNACEAACAEHPPFDGPVITVTPETVDHWPAHEEDLVDRVLSQISEKTISI